MFVEDRNSYADDEFLANRNIVKAGGGGGVMIFRMRTTLGKHQAGQHHRAYLFTAYCGHTGASRK